MIEGTEYTDPTVLITGITEGWADPETDPTQIDWPARQAAALIPFEVVDGRPVSPGRLGQMDVLPEVRGADDARQAAWLRADTYGVLLKSVAEWGGTIFTAHIDILVQGLGGDRLRPDGWAR